MANWLRHAAMNSFTPPASLKRRMGCGWLVHPFLGQYPGVVQWLERRPRHREVLSSDPAGYIR
jgi:hypothetical protein